MGTRSRYRIGQELQDYKNKRKPAPREDNMSEEEIQRRAERRDKNRGYTLDIIDIIQPHPPNGKHVFVLGRTYITRVYL